MAEIIFDEDNFKKEVLESKVPVLVDFWAEWCGPCRIQTPIIEEVAKDFADKDVKIGKLNVDQAPEVAGQFQVMSIPTIIIFKNGKPIEQMTGIQDKKSLTEKINSLIH